MNEFTKFNHKGNLQSILQNFSVFNKLNKDEKLNYNSTRSDVQELTICSTEDTIKQSILPIKKQSIQFNRNLKQKSIKLNEISKISSEKVRNYNYLFTYGNDHEISSKFKFPIPRNPIISKKLRNNPKEDQLLPCINYNIKKTSNTRLDNIICIEMMNPPEKNIKTKEMWIKNKLITPFINRIKKKTKIGHNAQHDIIKDKSDNNSINPKDKCQLKTLIIT